MAPLRAAGELKALTPGQRRVSIYRRWMAGGRVELDLDLPARFTAPDERIDAVRGCVALERGPLVYCVEAADLPDGVSPDDLEIDLAAHAVVGTAMGLPKEILALEVAGRERLTDGSEREWPYADTATQGEGIVRRPITMRAIPYFAWANRQPGPMRVWLPGATRDAESPQRAVQPPSTISVVPVTNPEAGEAR
jgi:uncharacterized protein